MSELRMAVIGVGWAGSRQIEAARELNDKIKVTCLVDTDNEFLHEKGAEFDIQKQYTDYQAALADPDIDAVSICTPHPLHKPMTIAAAQAGKHILVEKPMALTVADATAMINAAEEYDVKLYVAENEVYSAGSQFLRTVVQQGEYIGELVTATMIKGFRAENFAYPGRRAWLTQPDQGGTGTWMLHGIHSMAQLRYIFGEVETIYLCEHKADSYARRDLEGTMSGVLTMESGIHIPIIQTSEAKLSHNLGGYTLYGSQGNLQATASSFTIFEANQPQPAEQPYSEQPLSSYAQELEAFADYVADINVGPTTGYNERLSLAIVEAGYESMRQKRPIRRKDIV